MALIGEIECKQYPKAVWNFMTNEQQMQVRKLQEQQGIKPTAKQTSTGARIAALEDKLRISSHPKEGGVKKTKGEAPKTSAWGRNRKNPVMAHQALGISARNPDDP